jgi:alpha-1,2-glucosyltransferase
LQCRLRLEGRSAAARQASMYAYHTAINIAFFPVLFFFSALYYTDILSAVVVLVAYENHLARLEKASTNLINDLWTVILGVAALFMRQTNVFWVVVYMGGLEAVHCIRSLRPTSAEKPKDQTVGSLGNYYAWRYSVGDIHDPPLSQASIDGKNSPCSLFYL